MGQLIDDDAAAIVAQIQSLLKDLRAKGIDDKQIDSLVRQKPEIGRVIVDRTGLTLVDNGGLRVRLTPMERTLFILVVRHDDGIPSDELWRFWDELCDIYGKQTVFDDPDIIADSIDALCEDDKATLHTNVSRIKRKITDAAGDWIAQMLAIKRHKDGRYKVGIDPALVSVRI